MIVIEMGGGLGNQMFQFCLYKKLKSLRKDVYLDVSSYDLPGSLRRYELDRFIGIRREEIKFSNDSFRKRSNTSDALFIAKRFIFKRICRTYKDKIGVFQPEVYDMDWVRLVGYWQNESYFSDIRDSILECYTFDSNELDSRNRSLGGKMEKEQSVSLHVRRGDYLDDRNSHIYDNICTSNYYRRAVDYICKNVEHPIFYLFSDDIKWCKNNIGALYGDYHGKIESKFVDFNNGVHSYLDMYLMNKCRHHIIANSTFSWWGAWLGTNEDKIVVAPSRWLANHDTSDTICTDWIKV